MKINFFKKILKPKKEKPVIQEEYIESLVTIMSSPLWNKDITVLKKYLPDDVSDETIQYVYDKLFKTES